MLKKIKVYTWCIGFIGVIAILATVFHHPIQIIDALTSEPVPGFGINISIWRVIFEPLMGPLLFYLRADQPLLEFIVLLLWIISLSLIVPMARILLKKEERGGNGFIYGLLLWLKRIPLIFSIWLGVLWLMIFMWFPANTIVNNQENSILINTHSHSEYSHDGIISQEALQSWHRKNGFDAFFITDHNHHEKTLEAVKAQETGTLPGEPLIIGGEEYSGSNHMTLLGLNHNFSTRDLSDQQVIDSTHKDNGIVIVAHWFDGERKSIPYFIDMGVDGFEIANQGAGLTYDRRIFQNIEKACTTNGLLMNGVADYHGYGSPCFVWNALEIPGWHHMDMDQQRESILNLLRQKNMDKIRVLLYNDRYVFERSYAGLSPVYTLGSYFRTLNLMQILSWLIWLVLLRIIGRKMSYLKNSNSGGSMIPLEILSIASSLYLLVHGLILQNKAHKLASYNDIYNEYGTIMLLCGAGFLVYTLILIFIERKRKLTSKNDS